MRIDDELTALVRDRGHVLTRLAYQLTHDHAEAQDLTQDALLGVCRSWRARHGAPEHLEAYVRKAMLSAFLRRDRRASSVAGGDELAERGVAGFDTEIVERDAMWRALGTLPARQRAAVVMRFYEGLPDTEIAEILRCRPATVRSLVARGLHTLSEQRALHPVPYQGVDHDRG